MGGGGGGRKESTWGELPSFRGESNPGPSAHRSGDVTTELRNEEAHFLIHLKLVPQRYFSLP